MKNKGLFLRRALFLVLMLLLTVNHLPMGAEEDAVEEFFDLLHLDTRDDGGAYTIMDKEGNVLMRTARHVHVGDRWIGMDNRRWEVFSVEGDYATARYTGGGRQSWLQRVRSFIIGNTQSQSVQQQETTEKKIGIYSTHGAESYVPNDGADSLPEGGGIIDVAESLKEGLKENGVEAVQSKETHVPHDSNAYKRSRDTAQELMQDDVDAVIDVHRDALEAEEYLEDGMVQIQLVVGRQNQNQEANQEFAEKLKAIADEKYPGLVKGIFAAKGNYNQDMSPRSLLIEVGTHKNDKEAAQESVKKFADVVTIALYGSTEPTQQSEAPKATASRGTVWRTILWLLAIVVVGGGAYLYISAGSWEEMKRKLKGFTQGEFGDLFKLSLKNRDDNQS